MTTPIRILVLSLALGIGLGSCSPAQMKVESASLVLEGCRVLTMETPEIRSGISIVISGDTIAAMGPDSSFSLPAGVSRIACQDRYVLPGLTDMHVHLGDRSELVSYLLSGVTSVVNLGGDHLDLFSGDRLSVLDLRDSVEAGDFPGPTIYSAGQALDGDPATGPFQRALSSVDEAIAAVDEQYEEGYDFIKVYDALDVDRHRAIVRRAAELGLAVFGHVPEAVGVDATLTSGQAVVAHAEEFYPAIEDAEDLDAAISILANEVLRSGVAVIPNGAFINGLVLQLEDLNKQLDDPEVAYLAPSVRVWWEPRYNYYVNREDPAGFLNQSRTRHAWIRGLVRALHDQGVLLLAGSDASIPVALPGRALHQEIEEFAASGLSNYDALRTATANVGQFMSAHRPQRGEFGTIAVGRRADLIVMERNPLESLEALNALDGVVLRGRWIEKSTLWDLRERETEDARSAREAPAAAQIPEFDSADPVASFEAMSEYLARDGGRWVASNPNYDGSTASPIEFGLWFERDVNGLFLELRVVALFAERTVVSSRGHWAWHPERAELSHIMVDRGGGVTEALTTFPDARTFVTIASRSGPNGTTEHRDDNEILSADVHRNESFHRESDRWVSTGMYEWRRVVSESES